MGAMLFRDIERAWRSSRGSLLMVTSVALVAAAAALTPPAFAAGAGLPTLTTPGATGGIGTATQSTPPTGIAGGTGPAASPTATTPTGAPGTGKATGPRGGTIAPPTSTVPSGGTTAPSQPLSGGRAGSGALGTGNVGAFGTRRLKPARHATGGHKALVIALAAVGALLVLVLAAWQLYRRRAFEPHWLLTLRHAIAEAGFRVSATWAEFTDWVRLGH